MKKLIHDIKHEALKLVEKSEEEIALTAEKLKIRATKEPLESLLSEWFALTQEVSFRTIGLKHFDTQLVAGILLHKGKVVEMKTGEGKTLVSTLPVALNALAKKGVHVVTVNDYLAERDQSLMGKIYAKLGLSVGLVKSTTQTVDKQKSYSSDITYVTNSELVFDFLRDSSALNIDEVVLPPFYYCLIDEIDSILIDEARTPLILSTMKQNENLNKLFLAKAISTVLEINQDFQIDEKRKEIHLTDKGYNEVKKRLGKKTLYDPKDPWILYILNALKANHLFHRNKDYIILKNKIVIVDEFTGRIMEDRRWSLGLHESIEIKEKLKIAGGTKTKSSITYQNFFTLYPRLAGMSGTAKTAEKEFKDIYNLDVIVLPTVKPLIRKDLPDFVYQTELAKWKNVLSLTKKNFKLGQPTLIGTSSIEKSEFLSDLFTTAKIPHKVLNAKPENVVQESEIIAQAGERFAITIATNMAGRGTDIILGGNPEFKIKNKLKEILKHQTQIKQKTKIKIDLKNSESLEKAIKKKELSLENNKDPLNIAYKSVAEDIYKRWEQENAAVKALGGLFVLGTERHESRRIDDQLRGRAGRQGDPGVSQFFISLDDDIIKIFGGESIKRWVGFLIKETDEPLESNILTKSLENAQKKIENHNYELRKNIFQYDDILNLQRKKLFKARREILVLAKCEDIFLRFNESFFDEVVNEKDTKNSYISTIEEKFGNYTAHAQLKHSRQKSKLNQGNNYKELWISQDLHLAESNLYGQGLLKTTRINTLLNIMDFSWTEHIERMNFARETINWKSYGQQNPLLEYNAEALKSFKLMLEEIRLCMLYSFLKTPINYS